MPNLWEKCPNCETEMHPYVLDIYTDGLTITLRFNRCKSCNAITGVDAKFTLDAVH
jgi:hypothetical protein